MTNYNYSIGEILLSLQNISLTLGKNLILRDVNINIHDVIRPGVTQGQIVGFLGPSGRGKTKLFEIIAGVRNPTTGSVLIGPKQEPVIPGNVGVVQQTYPLFDHRTVFSNLMEAAKLCEKCGSPTCDHNFKKKEDRVMELLTMFRLEDHKDKYPRQLSGGQRQRAAIAQQLLCSESILLLDEPFSGLDPNMTREVSKMIVNIANRNDYNTVIIVSHDIPAVSAIADTLWLMGQDRNEDGSLVPGAYIKYVYDLAAQGLAWHDDIRRDPRFIQLMWDLEEKFKSL